MRISLVFVVILLSLAHPARAAEDRTRMVLIQPLGIGASSPVTWEQAVGDSFSWSLGAAFNSTGSGSSGGNGSFLTAALTPGASWFLSGTAPAGAWVGLRFTAAYMRSDLSPGSLAASSTRAYGGAVMFGYNAIVGPGLAIQAAAGLGAGGGSTSSSSGNGVGGLVSLGGIGFASTAFSAGIRSLLSIGWAF